MEKVRCLKIYSEKIRGLKILGFSEEKPPNGYSPLKMTAPYNMALPGEHRGAVAPNALFPKKRMERNRVRPRKIDSLLSVTRAHWI